MFDNFLQKWWSQFWGPNDVFLAYYALNWFELSIIQPTGRNIQHFISTYFNQLLLSIFVYIFFCSKYFNKYWFSSNWKTIVLTFIFWNCDCTIFLLKISSKWLIILILIISQNNGSYWQTIEVFFTQDQTMP